MKYFSMPSDFRPETVDRYYEINNRYPDSKVIETYGQLAPDTLFGSGRMPVSLPAVDIKELEKYVGYSLGKGLDFNYTFNATCMGNEELTEKGRKEIVNFVATLESIGVGWVTISLPPLMEIVHHSAPKMKIKASTLCQIDSPLKAKFYEGLGIGKIVLDEDIYRRFDILRDIGSSYGGDLEAIVNSYCINDCPYKIFHFNSFSHSHKNPDMLSYYTSRCRFRHMDAANYMKMNWIRPEDLHYYIDAGINHFKLQGRTTAYRGDPAKAVTFYIDEYYDGNLISLLELFSPDRPFTMLGTEVDNRKLDGFIEKFVRDPGACGKLCDKCGYCESYAKKSMNPGDYEKMEFVKSMKSLVPDSFFLP